MCQKFQASQVKEPLQPVDVPAIPWHTIGTDLFALNGDTHLIIADYHSKYPIVEKMSTYSSKAVTNITTKVFSMFGFPNTIISDNGPQFTGREYQEMVKQHNIAHMTSSPHHPKSHGFVERMVRTVKAMFTKTSNHENALLMYRSTTTGPSLPSPAEILFGRKICTNIPTHITPRITDQHREYLNKKKKDSEKLYNTNSRPLSELNIDEDIYYQDVAKRTWSPGVIIGVGPEPRSYTIKCSITGRELRRNRQLIRPRDAPAPPINIPCDFPFGMDEEIEKADTSIQDTSPSPPVNSKPTTQQTPPTPTQQAQVSKPTSAEKAPIDQPTATPVPAPVPAPVVYRTRYGRKSTKPKRYIEETLTVNVKP